MKTVLWKWFFDYEKEEAWLNKMSAKGFAAIDFFMCRYVFEDCTPGEYIYRSEFLKQPAKHAESQRYIRFMEENGAEHVSSWFQWVYFRKKASDGVFDIFSDLDSKLEHYRRINAFWLTVFIVELLAGAAQIPSIVLHFADDPYSLGPFHIFAMALTWSLSVFFLLLRRRLGKKIKKLQQERLLRE